MQPNRRWKTVYVTWGQAHAKFELAKSKKEEQALGFAKNQAQSQAKDQFMKADGKDLPFR